MVLTSARNHKHAFSAYSFPLFISETQDDVLQQSITQKYLLVECVVSRDFVFQKAEEELRKGGISGN